MFKLSFATLRYASYIHFVGNVKANQNRQREHQKRLYAALREEWEIPPPLKSFSPKCQNLTILANYPKGEDLGIEYWGKWSRREYEPEKGSMVDHMALDRIARRLAYRDMHKVQHVAEMLKEGARLGVEQEGRWPSQGANSPTAYEFGERVADSLQTGIIDGYLCGPFSKEDVETIWPEGVKISPILVRLKPNGAARIIMDLSYPHDQELGNGVPCSPNEGMKNFKEFEEVQMTTDKKFRKAMFWSGWPAEVMKTDWCIAYKHISVHRSDHHLQLVEFGGRFFLERCLTFGGGNSPTLYNMVAKLLINLAEIMSGMDPRHNCQQLDDNCTAGPRGSQKMRKYLECYRKIAEEIGVKLASEDDPSKAFPPKQKGEILGIVYDGQNWTWEMPYDKGQRLLVQIGEAIRSGYIKNGDAISLAGRINHYSSMVKGKFNRCLLVHLGKSEERDEKVIKIGTQAMLSLVWWLLNLRVLQKCGARIPNPNDFLVNTALTLYSDAAGGASKLATQGWGVVNVAGNEWARGSWPKFIIKNTLTHGRRWGRSLTFLEGFACLITVPLWAKEIQQAGGAALMCDNMGFVWANHSGNSRDEYIWTLSKCLDTLAEGLGVPIKVFHTRRRTRLGDTVADDLSKNNLDRVQAILPRGEDISWKVSRVLTNWLTKPFVSTELGREILKELKGSSEAEVHVGISYRTAANELGAKLHKDE